MGDDEGLMAAIRAALSGGGNTAPAQVLGSRPSGIPPTSQYRPTGIRDPALVAVVGRSKSTEGFAQAFAAALESLRAEGTGRAQYNAATYGQHPRQNDIAALRSWVLKQPAYAGYSPAPIRPDATMVQRRCPRLQ